MYFIFTVLRIDNDVAMRKAVSENNSKHPSRNWGVSLCHRPLFLDKKCVFCAKAPVWGESLQPHKGLPPHTYLGFDLVPL